MCASVESKMGLDIITWRFYPHTIIIISIGWARHFAAERKAGRATPQIQTQTHIDCGLRGLSPKQRWCWAMHFGWVKLTRFPNSEPFVALISHPTNPSIIIWVSFWVGAVPFKPSLPFLLLLLLLLLRVRLPVLLPCFLQSGTIETRTFIAVVLTVGMTLMGPHWNGIGIVGAAISLRLNKPRALHPFSRYPFILCLCLFKVWRNWTNPSIKSFAFLFFI